MELWRDKWCATCRKLSRYTRDQAGVWRCRCGTAATPAIAAEIDRRERQQAGVKDRRPANERPDHEDDELVEPEHRVGPVYDRWLWSEKGYDD